MGQFVGADDYYTTHKKIVQEHIVRIVIEDNTKKKPVKVRTVKRS